MSEEILTAIDNLESAIKTRFENIEKDVERNDVAIRGDGETSGIRGAIDKIQLKLKAYDWAAMLVVAILITDIVANILQIISSNKVDQLLGLLN